MRLLTVKQGVRLAALFCAVGWACGCKHLAYQGEGLVMGEMEPAQVNPANPFIFPGQQPPEMVGLQAPPPAALPPPAAPRPPSGGLTLEDVKRSFQSPQAATIRFKVGDTMTVTFSDLPAVHQLPERRENIREDGRITLYYGVSVQAEGRTAAELQEAIQKEYVPRYYHYLTVTVKSEEKTFYVGGEVRLPARLPYVGNITVLRAIESAGGFTDFSNKKNIEVRRASGTLKVNWHNAIKDSRKDPVVYPDDHIIVHKRAF